MATVRWRGTEWKEEAPAQRGPPGMPRMVSTACRPPRRRVSMVAQVRGPAEWQAFLCFSRGRAGLWLDGQ